MEHDDTKHNAGVEETLLCSSYNLKRLCCTTLVHSTCLNPAPNYEKKIPWTLRFCTKLPWTNSE